MKIDHGSQWTLRVHTVPHTQFNSTCLPGVNALTQAAMEEPRSLTSPHEQSKRVWCCP